jgi:hypothetical protein
VRLLIILMNSRRVFAELLIHFGKFLVTGCELAIWPLSELVSPSRTYVCNSVTLPMFRVVFVRFSGQMFVLFAFPSVCVLCVALLLINTRTSSLYSLLPNVEDEWATTPFASCSGYLVFDSLPEGLLSWFMIFFSSSTRTFGAFGSWQKRFRTTCLVSVSVQLVYHLFVFAQYNGIWTFFFFKHVHVQRSNNITSGTNWYANILAFLSLPLCLVLTAFWTYLWTVRLVSHLWLDHCLSCIFQEKQYGAHFYVQDADVFEETSGWLRSQRFYGIVHKGKWNCHPQKQPRLIGPFIGLKLW